MNSRMVEASSPVTEDELEKISFMPTSYQAYVKALCSRNPCLFNLHTFLTDPNIPQHGCRVVALDFREGIDHPIVRSLIDLDYLGHELRDKPSKERDRSNFALHEGRSLQGRILVIEDLTKEVIELLGSELDIDPLFFAMHLHTVHRTGRQHQTADEATLPSRLSSSNYTNVLYHRAVTSSNISPYGGRLVRDTIIDRKLVFLRSTTIGLAQHCTSVIRTKSKSSFWIALILVDPAISDTYYLDGRKRDQQHKVHLSTQPFLGAYEDFLEPPAFSEGLDHMELSTRGGMLDDLQYYWNRKVPSCFDSKDPSLQSLAYYPLKIVAAEWVKYVAVMQQCIKQYEYQHDRLPELDQFNKDLRELQGWRRRSMISQGKVRSILRLLKTEEQRQMTTGRDIPSLIEDFELIDTKIESAGHRLENMLPVTTTLVQIADARRSFAETANISRLTVLALIFVPLTFVASLFSMSDYMPGTKDFWVYFAVAIPVTGLVVLIARPPINTTRKVIAWTKDRRKHPIPLQRRPTFMLPSRKESEP